MKTRRILFSAVIAVLLYFSQSTVVHAATNPSIVSLTPSVVTSAPGVSQGFTAVYGDSNGYAYISTAYIVVGSGVNGITAFYNKSDARIYLWNDAGTGSVDSCIPGVLKTLSNSQGSINCISTTVTRSGSNLTVNWNITPKTAFASSTKKNVYLYAGEATGSNTGWLDKGDWTISNIAPVIVSLTPSAVTGTPGVAQSFSAVYSDSNRYTDIATAYIVVGSGVNGITALYNKSDARIYLWNDAGTGYAGSCNPGVSGTLSNTQGSINCGTTTVSGSGDNLTVNWSITPKTAFVSVTAKNVYLYAGDTAGLNTGWLDRGDWTIQSNVAPVIVSLTPSSVTSAPGVAQSFSAVYSDGNGYSTLASAYIVVGSGVNGVTAFYNKSDGKIYLWNDAGTGYAGSCNPGVSGTLSNTQGSINCGITTVSGSGNNLTVNWSITPKKAFVSVTAKNVYLYAGDTAGLNTGWLDRGDWMIALDESSPFGYHPAEVSKFGYADNGYSDAQYIGVKWARVRYAFWFFIQPDLNSNVYDFSIYDDEYLSVPDNMNTVAIISHLPEDLSTYTEYTIPGSYMPSDTAKYLAFVKATIERYDGDGIDDAPGLTNPIKYWEVENEPSTTVAPDFGDLQRITYIAIKDACADCTVIIGGAASINSADFDQHYKPFLDGLGGNYLDVMDFHWFGDATGDYRNVKTLYNHIRDILDGYGLQSASIWINESGSYSGTPTTTPASAAQTERQQAMDYLKRFVYYLSIGVRRSFSAFGLMEGFKNDNGYFDHTGIIYDGQGSDDLGLGVKKLAYYTYKKMTEKLEGSDWSNIVTVRESSFVYVYGFTDKTTGATTYVAWWDYFSDPTYPGSTTKQVTISWPGSVAPTVTEALPMFDTGQEVTDYSTAFTTYTTPLTSGSITITLSDSPVFIEE